VRHCELASLSDVHNVTIVAFYQHNTGILVLILNTRVDVAKRGFKVLRGLPLKTIAVFKHRQITLPRTLGNVTLTFHLLSLVS